MSSKFYWRDGTVAVDFDWHDTDHERWHEAMQALEKKLGDIDYKRVASTDIPGYWISTVWLGLDHNFMGDKPLIFETMVFADDDTGEVDMERYSTEKEALAGHKKLVKKWSKK